MGLPPGASRANRAPRSFPHDVSSTRSPLRTATVLPARPQRLAKDTSNRRVRPTFFRFSNTGTRFRACSLLSAGGRVLPHVRPVLPLRLPLQTSRHLHRHASRVPWHGAFSAPGWRAHLWYSVMGDDKHRPTETVRTSTGPLALSNERFVTGEPYHRPEHLHLSTRRPSPPYGGSLRQAATDFGGQSPERLCSIPVHEHSREPSNPGCQPAGTSSLAGTHVSEVWVVRGRTTSLIDHQSAHLVAL